MGGFNPMAAVTLGVKVADDLSQRKRQQSALAEQQNLQSQALWQQQAQRAKQQRDLLKRQMASARAALAGGGVGFGGGSGAALLAGMARQTEDDIAAGHDSTALRHRLQFGDGGRASGIGLQQGLQLAQQGMQVLKPLFGN